MALGGQNNKKTGTEKKRIGKGLDALIPSGGVAKTVEKPVKVEDKDGVVNVKISKVEPNREQPRKNFDEDALSNSVCFSLFLYRKEMIIMKSSQVNVVGVQQILRA